jgi:hypothetical protein
MTLRNKLLLVVFALLAGSGSSRAVVADQPSSASEYIVTVHGTEGEKPGVPIVIRVRGRDGSIVVESKTDASGTARFKLSSVVASSRPSLEALLDLGAGRTIGVIETLSRECNAYELFLPKFEVMQCHGTIVKSP